MSHLTVRGFNLSIIFLIIFTFTPVAVFHSTAQAAMVDSQMIDTGENASTLREINEIKVRRALENKIVAEKLKGHGLTAEEVSEKLATMTDDQVHQIASLTDRIPAGGNGAVGIVVAILVIVALVLLIVYLWKRV
jgi:uncharacterized membrane protein